MMDWFRSPKSFPYIVVATATFLMLVILKSGEHVSITFPLLLFMSAKLSVIFGSVEIGLSCIGRYENKEDIYRAISRAISAFGMAMSFMLLIGAYEAAKA
ncbi:hypothetical protein [Microbulbifer sp. THAF38]|uniref:hypothetical protein n=1 Tax=Microbulbifer sp. THAF38 TaxID=2587856 RepID=UPI0012A9D703|nr:hypothetical protein [Microbulbifer sp. THAF38]QFT57125.1 hypothetical protein FIU95_21470 [Microbulbifer sp. THAF38]